MQTAMQPAEMESARGGIPLLFLPLRDDLFAARASRFRALAANHTLGEFLLLMGEVAESQQQVFDAFPVLPSPSPRQLEECRHGGLPPLGVLGWQREPVWREGLELLLDGMAAKKLPEPAGASIERLRRCGGEELERFAVGLLNQEFDAVPPGVAPFVAGALQVYWTAMARTLEGQNLPRLEPANLCPVCGSLPVVSLVRSGGNENGLRYLCCPLCASQWHKVRTVCANCDSGKGITYYRIEDQPGPVIAESCANCRIYLKCIRQDQEAGAEPVADDLATIALDLLMEREGYRRLAGNPLFHPGNA